MASIKYLKNISARVDGDKSSVFATLRNVLIGVLASALFTGCVSQDNALSLGGTQQSLSNQPGIEVPTGVEFPAQETANLVASTHAPLPSNVPQPAPRGGTPSDEIQTAALAVSDPNPKPIPAQRVIQSATTGTAEVTSTGTVAAPSTQESAAISQNEANALAETVEPVVAPQPAKPKITGLFARLFQSGGNSGSSANSQKNNHSIIRERGDDDRRIVVAHAGTSSSVTSDRRSLRERINRSNQNALPGVKSNSQLFGINRNRQQKTADDNTAQTQLAALGSLGRLSPNGLRVQHEKVQVACLKPGILRILKVVERHYGKKPIITSGYRSPKRNRRAGGVKNSMHIFCKAVDIQIEGVSKWDLAKYLRTIPGRGGVGTYCRTKSVHIDTGSVRDWHHPCRRSSKRKKRKA